MNSASENATDLPSSDDLTPAADDQSDEIPEF
jgi:hypothetical protein